MICKPEKCMVSKNRLVVIVSCGSGCEWKREVELGRVMRSMRPNVRDKLLTLLYRLPQSSIVHFSRFGVLTPRSECLITSPSLGRGSQSIYNRKRGRA